MKFARLFASAALAATMFAGPTAPALAAAPAFDLEPYRALARGADGSRLLEIARASLRSPDAPRAAAHDPSGWPPPPAALYVTLVRGATTRACVGHEPPQGADLADAVRALASQARAGDRRRPPVRDDELATLRLVIGFAAPAEPVADAASVDPGREGLLIETERGRVAFLPGEARTVAWAVREARRIGVLTGAASAARYSRFDVVTLKEAAPSAARETHSDSAR